MKRLILICLLAVSMAAFTPMAKADNPVTWNFYLETSGARDDDGPLSPPIDLGYDQYLYDWVITDTNVLIMGEVWAPGPNNLSGSGSFGPPNPIPFTDELIYQYSSPEIDFDILASVDSGGYGTVSIDNIIFGQDVTGFQLNGNVTVEGVPEPATVCLLGLGVLGLLRRRK